MSFGPPGVGTVAVKLRPSAPIVAVWSPSSPVTTTLSPVPRGGGERTGDGHGGLGLLEEAQHVVAADDQSGDAAGRRA